MSELKTKATTQSASEFIKAIEPEEKQKDSQAILKIMEKVTGEKPVMWGPSIVGFGSYHYKSVRSSQEGDWMLIGFSPRKQNLTIYLMAGFEGYQQLLDKLGKHKTSVGCLYIKKLSDVDMEVLTKLIDKSYKEMKAKHKV